MCFKALLNIMTGCRPLTKQLCAMVDLVGIYISLMSKENIFTVIPINLKQHRLCTYAVCFCVWVCVVERLFFCLHVDFHKKFLALQNKRLKVHKTPEIMRENA